MTQDNINLILGLNSLVEDLVRLERYEIMQNSEARKACKTNPLVEWQILKSNLYEDMQKSLDKFKEINYTRTKIDDDSSELIAFVEFFGEQYPLFSAPFIINYFFNTDMLTFILNNPKKIKASTEFKELLKKYNEYVKNPDKLMPEYIDVLREDHISSIQTEIETASDTKAELIQELEDLNSSKTYKQDIKNSAFNRMFRSKQLQHQESRHALELNINAYNDRLRTLNEELMDVKSNPEKFDSYYTKQVKQYFQSVKSAGKFMSTILEAKDILINFQQEHPMTTGTDDSLDFAEMIHKKSHYKTLKNHARAQIFAFLEMSCPDNIEEILASCNASDLPNNISKNMQKIVDLVDEYLELKSNNIPIITSGLDQQIK